MGARRKARELALQMLFQHDMSGNAPDQILTTFEELQKSKPNTREFATRIFRGTVDHDVTLASGPAGFASPSMRKGTFSHRFGRAGTYRLFCSLHPARMTQLVIVR